MSSGYNSIKRWQTRDLIHKKYINNVSAIMSRKNEILCMPWNDDSI